MHTKFISTTLVCIFINVFVVGTYANDNVLFAKRNGTLSKSTITTTGGFLTSGGSFTSSSTSGITNTSFPGNSTTSSTSGYFTASGSSTPPTPTGDSSTSTSLAYTTSGESSSEVNSTTGTPTSSDTTQTVESAKSATDTIEDWPSQSSFLPVVISVGGVLVIGAAVITVICVRKRRKETEDEIWATDILGRSVRP